jgi:hypothetical protein
MPRVLIYAFIRLGTAGFTHFGFRVFWALRQACSLIDLAGSVDGCYAMFGPSTTAMQSATAVPVHGGLVRRLATPVLPPSSTPSCTPACILSCAPHAPRARMQSAHSRMRACRAHAPVTPPTHVHCSGSQMGCMMIGSTLGRRRMACLEYDYQHTTCAYSIVPTGAPSTLPPTRPITRSPLIGTPTPSIPVPVTE